MFINKKYSIRLIVVSTTLFLSAVFLAIALQTSGPRVRNISADNEQFSAHTKYITIQTNRLLKQDAPDVIIEPNMKFKASVQGSAITLRLFEPLKSGTEYQVFVRGLTDKNNQYTTEQIKSFTTKSEKFFGVNRESVDGLTEVFYYDISAQTKQTILKDSNIYAVTHTKNNAYILRGQDNSYEFSIEKILSNNKTITIANFVGAPTLLRSSNNGELLLLQYIDSTQKNFLVQINTKSNSVSQLFDINQQPLSVADAHYASDGTTIFLQDIDGSAYVRASDGRITPLGSVFKLSGQNFDGTSIALITNDEPIFAGIIQNDQLKEASFSTATDIAFLSQTSALASLQTDLSAPMDAYQRVKKTSLDTKESETLFSQSLSEGYIFKIFTSIDKTKVAIERSPQTSQFDNSPIENRPLNTETVLVDTNNPRNSYTIFGHGQFVYK